MKPAKKQLRRYKARNKAEHKLRQTLSNWQRSNEYQLMYKYVKKAINNSIWDYKTSAVLNGL